MFVPANLNDMDIPARDTLMRFLGEVVSWGGDYYLEEGYEYRGKQTHLGCRIVFEGENAPPPTAFVYAHYSYLDDWHRLEIAVPAMERDRVSQFSEGVMAWYLENRRLSEHEIRVLLARKLYQRFLDNQESEPFDVDVVAGELHLTPVQVYNQARVLVQLGYATSRRGGRAWVADSPPLPPLTPTQGLGHYKLSEDGHRWRAAGFPEEANARSTNVTVNVDVHMAVTTVIQEARHSGVDEATKLQFEALMRRIEEELEKPEGEGTMQPVKDAIEVANNAKGLLGPLVKFLYNNWDKIQNLGGMMF